MTTDTHLIHAIENYMMQKAGRWLNARNVCEKFSVIPVDYDVFLDACRDSVRIQVRTRTDLPTTIRYIRTVR